MKTPFHRTRTTSAFRLVLAFGLAVSVPAGAAPSSGAARSSANGGSPVIATVGSVGITQAEVDRRTAEMQGDAERQMGGELTPQQMLSLKRQALETLIRADLFKLEANRRKSAITNEEAEAELKKLPIFNPQGTFSQRAWDNARRNDPKGFQEAIDKVKLDLARGRLTAEYRKKSVPPDDQLRRAVERELKTADLDAFLLPRAEIGTRWPEPRETAVLDYYRDHRADFQRPAQAQVEAVSIEAIPGDAQGRGLRARADSAIAELRRGRPIGETADRFGGTVRTLFLREDNLPGSWKASPSVTADVYRQAAGTVLSAPVPTAGGVYAVRVVSASPRGAAPLREVAPAIRRTLREATIQREEDKAVRAMYTSSRDSAARSGYKVRYAIVEASRLRPGEPRDADLKDFYESRRAEYTRYDAASGSLVVTPLDQVRDDLIRKWKDSRRDLMARDVGFRIADAWRRDQRDRSAEASAQVRDLGAIVINAPIDTGAVAAAITDSLRQWLYARRVEMIPISGGFAVVSVYELLERVVPTLDQLRPALAERWRAELDAEETRKAQELYEKSPQRISNERVVYYSRLVVPLLDILDVPLTKKEVEQYYKEHLDQYATPEKFRVSMILVRPEGSGQDARKRALDKAKDIRRRAVGGEDFGDLAAKLSDDDITREERGDLGLRAAGELDPTLEQAAFALKVGEVSDPVETTDGFVLLQVTEHQPLTSEPLPWVYSSVGSDAANEKSSRIALHIADSLSAALKTPADGRRAAAKLGYQVEQFQHRPGDRQYPADKIRTMEVLERLRPGQMFPGGTDFGHSGAAAMWVDSIAPPTKSLNAVMREYRRTVGRGAFDAKRAEIDSLMAAGWAFDSLAALWGGPLRDEHYSVSSDLAGYRSTDPVDAVVFGDGSTPAITIGTVSSWLDLDDAAVRVRVNARREPQPLEIAERMDRDRGLVAEYRMTDDIKELKQRFPVRILDPVLREIALPTPPAPPEL